MTVRNRTYAVAVALAMSVAALESLPLLAQAPATEARPAPLDQAIPMDPTVTTGTLPNGLRYYVRANTEPANRAELRLVVNVGSIVEADDQRGLAHFVEHMAFNGTTRFPKQALVAFMESVGMRFGPSVNAYTSFDETVYMLQVPTDKPDVVDTALRILEDWAHAVTMAGDEIDKERGVVIEEWRLRRGAGARMLDRQFPILLAGSTYAERLPIGTTEILETFPHERLRQFYRDWYRPDLMAVVAVGDFDGAAMADTIRRRFAAIPAAASPRPRPVVPVPDRPGTAFAIAVDPEATSSTVTVLRKADVRDQSTVGAYRRSLTEQLFAGLLSARLAELAQKPDAPFVAAGAGRGSFVRTKDVSMINGLAKEGRIAETLAAMLREAERVSQHGFTTGELDRQKTTFLRGYERQVTERHNQPSAQLAAEYIRHYLEGEPVPGIELEYELAVRLLPAITLDDINRLARGWVADGNRVIQVSAPEKAGVPVPDEAALAAVMADVAASPVEAYVDTTTDAPLLEPLPAAGRIASETPADAHGISEWRLSNGARVVLLPTSFKEDEVIVRAFSPGGSSLVSDEDFVAADSATAVLGAGGLGAFNALDLRKKLVGKVANAGVSIGELEETVSGSASKKDLETLFELIHLRFTQPRADPEAFAMLQNQMRALLANQEASPGFAFASLLQAVLTNDHVRSRPLTVDRLDQMNLDRSLAIYRERFADAGDFTFIVVGSFEPLALRPLVERYLASLPALGRVERWRDLGVTRPTGIVERRVEKGLEPQSRAAIVFAGPVELTVARRNALRAMTSILQTRLRDTLREDLGGTYSVGVSSATSRWPRPEYQVSVSFGSAPDRNDALVARTFEEMARFRDTGPTATEVSDAIEALVRAFETSREQNGFLAAQLHTAYRDGTSLDDVFGAVDAFRAITGEAIHAAARAFLTPDRYVKVQLFPEKR
ncbi:MAG TPA: insulinase family protein [Vicinamibacterales bacterium]|nr:insulinase family protein [Vicinamibacterales bacterium]